MITGDESRLQETEEMGHSSSCSSPGNRSYDGDEYSYNLEITDESELDGEVGKRLTEIVPVPVSLKKIKDLIFNYILNNNICFTFIIT